MKPQRTSFGFAALIILAMMVTSAGAIDVDVEATASGSSTSNLFSDSTSKNDTYSTSSVDLNCYPLSFAKLNLVSEYTYYGNFFNLSNLVYGGGFTIIPIPDSSRFSTYFEGNVKKREYRHNDKDTVSLNANEITGDQYDAKIGVGYDLGHGTQLRTGLSFASTQYKIGGIIDREKFDLTAGVNTTQFGAYTIDLELGFSTGKYQNINPMKYYPSLDTTMPRLAILPGEQYSILLVNRLKSVYISPRLSRSIGRKTGLSLTYSHRQFLDRDTNAIIYGYSTGYLSPWLGEYAGDAVVLKVKTYLFPRLITSFSVGYWEREHIRTVERELKPNRFGQMVPVLNLLYAQDRTDWRRRIDFKVQWPMHLSGGVVLEPSLQADYTDNNSTVLVYKYDDFSANGGITVRF